MKKHIQASITIQAMNQKGLIDRLEQALAQIKQGYLLGTDSSPAGSYAFNCKQAAPNSSGLKYHEAAHIGYKVIPCQHTFANGKFTGLKHYQQGTIPDCYGIFALTWQSATLTDEQRAEISELQLASCPSISQADQLAETYRQQLSKKLAHNHALTARGLHDQNPK